VLTANGKVLSLSASAAQAEWEKTFAPIPLSTVRFAGPEVIFATAADHRLRVLSAADGTERETIDTRYPVTAVAVVGEDLVWGDDRGNIVRYDRGGRSRSWRFRNGARISGLITFDEQMIATSLDNFVYSIAASTGRVRWKRRQPGRISDVPLVDDDLGIILTFGEPKAALVELRNGRSIGQYEAGENESFLQPPIAAGERYVFFTNERVSMLSRSGCAK
jgi:outer membrane protein assembly factor BamB